MLARITLAAALACLFAVPAAAAASPSPSPERTLARSAAAMDGRGTPTGRELTPLLKDLAVAAPRLSGADRRRARRILLRPTQGDSSAGDQAYTVAEHDPPYCSAHFCVHWVDSTGDAPPPADDNANGVPDYVETMSGVFEHVYDEENVRLGWRAPKSDGARGCPGAAESCMNKTDVYISDVGGRSVYGYAAPDPGQRTYSQQAYLVMDNDYSKEQFAQYGGNSLPPMEVTAAHEYNHVLQFGYDVAQDTWMFESTATWMEDKVYTEVNDYLQYIGVWARLSPLPMTRFSGNSSDPYNLKAYGAAVWNQWLEAKFGPDLVRTAWERSLSTKPDSYAPLAYDSALRSRGSSFSAAFSAFTADTAEWRTPGSPFPEGGTYPDMVRASNDRGQEFTLRPGSAGVGGRLDHTGYVLLDVPPVSAPRLKLVVELGRGTQGALSMVARTGFGAAARYTPFVRRLSKGGTGIITMASPRQYTRITAVVTNADISESGYSRALGDWMFDQDDQPISARVSTDFTAPKVRSRVPGSHRRGVSRRTRVRALFSERMRGVDTHTVTLSGPGGRHVKAKVSLTSRGKRLTIKPSRTLRARTSYTVKLSTSIRDLGGNKLPSSSRKWRFTTGS